MDNNLSNFSASQSGRRKRGWGPGWRDTPIDRLQLLRDAPSLPRFGEMGQWPNCHCEWGRSWRGKDEAGWNMWHAAQPQAIPLSEGHPRGWVTLLSLNSACLNPTYVPIPMAAYWLPPHLNLTVVLSIPAEMPSEPPSLEALGMRLSLCFISWYKLSFSP